MIHCLIVDDDEKLVKYVANHLSQENFCTHSFFSGEEALDYLEDKPVDIAIVDIMMKGMNGFELCKVLKEDYDIPVIMLTARDALSDKERAFLSGTDDYVTKPFEVKELLFRIRAVLRRYQINASDEVKLGNLTLNQSYMELSVNSKTMTLPNKEFQVIFLLTSNPKHIFTRNDMIEKIWGFDYEGDDRTVDVHIKRLRQRLSKLGATISIQTVRGQGYRVNNYV
ncbi:response regulator transcription factor [Staphylococcus saccharolyticus]|uniref:Heme response regulator HssR n=1 Tax=Staphylococcus saccharolyticus TaxID=33028 RepID=A0A380H2S3_9STAP|nr:response regulator transcription factor [Staphylococcus saccharolyticus]MBL7564809.1 response regulator transcription factor [Staphylococcus saccharolyticus]MBL7570927.1 response regulator transcription factor [Staphylococcus saccharolyticus]QQB98785.1 response regulator transcription factor [Staphylococcus saccharolyticus]QRJ67000.1 response regulator transcription factor [Staphylococcus saccharolyticus]RTX94412.1 response regulator transcription factor [Staphylococcus saccharolyticus]